MKINNTVTESTRTDNRKIRRRLGQQELYLLQWIKSQKSSIYMDSSKMFTAKVVVGDEWVEI